MPVKRTTPKPVRQTMTYADLEQVLKATQEGRSQLHEQVDEIMKALAAHKGHERAEAIDWAPIKKAIEVLLKLWERILGKPPHLIGAPCFTVLREPSGDQAKRRLPPKWKGTKK
jgi:hypothetical protein